MGIASLRRSPGVRLAAVALALLVGGGVGPQSPRLLGRTPAKAPAGRTTPAAYDQVRVINEQIAAQWKANQLAPSRRATDHEFIRRVTLDVIGRIATPKEIDRFLADPAASRRALLVQRLLDSPEFSRNWANIWTVWLMTRSGAGRYHEQMQDWLEKQFADKSRGWDKIVTDLLTASGKSDENGAVNFILSNLGESIPPGDEAEEGHYQFVPITSRTTRLFLGLQIQCTQCHDHPFNSQWKQRNFWGVNAFFRQVKGDRPVAMTRRGDFAPALSLADDSQVNKEAVVFYEERKGTVLMARPEFLDGRKLVPNSESSRRQALAEFVTTSPYFPRAYVNRLWAHFFGRGFTNPGPADDFGEHNPITHPLLPAEIVQRLQKLKGPVPEDLAAELKKYEDDRDKPRLLDYLAEEFKKYGYDTRQLITWICNSDAYQLGTVANDTNDKPDAEPYFSRMLLKAMSPEQLFESLMTATRAEAAETREGKKGLREQWMQNLIVNFGDDEGNEVTFNGTVVQALMLMNGKEINDVISNREKGTLVDALRHRSPKAAVDTLFLASLNRYPTDKEFNAIQHEMSLQRTGKVRTHDATSVFQDVFWALLNSNEFILNH